eukprot:603091-Prorocentrum_lima.AAC.1
MPCIFAGETRQARKMRCNLGGLPELTRRTHWHPKCVAAITFTTPPANHLTPHGAASDAAIESYVLLWRFPLSGEGCDS